MAAGEGAAAPDADPPTVREPRGRPENSSGYSVDRDLHNRIENFFKDLKDRNRDFQIEHGHPEFETKAMRERSYLSVSIAFSGGWFFGSYGEMEVGVAVASDLDGGFFETKTRGFGFGLPGGVAINVGFAKAASAADLAGVSANTEVEVGKLGVAVSVSPGEDPGELSFSGALSLGVGPNMPFSVSDTKVETFHEIYEKLQQTMDRLSGDRDVTRWLGE